MFGPVGAKWHHLISLGKAIVLGLYNGAPRVAFWGYGGRILDLNPRRPHVSEHRGVTTPDW